MKPALSLVAFTVASGAGLGLAAWVLAWQLADRIDGSAWPFWAAVALAAALLTIGLLSSTRHLANPRNAWRSFTRFRTSWLSREAVLVMAFYPLAAVHLVFSVGGDPRARTTALLALVLALSVVVCTAMIYACLRTVPRWRTWHTVAGFVAYALASGGLLWAAILASDGRAPPPAALLLAPVVAAALVKLAWDAKFSARVHATLNEALAVPETAPKGVVQGRVRLLDAGHVNPTFVTNEFGFRLARERASTLRLAMFALTLGVPVAVAVLAPGAAGRWVAAVALLAGVAVERWLFFARAEHVVRLYDGQARV
ncbi:MAG: dimethyl sulfoxide reductase anchor subunit [Burkholderiaceae bacterium]|jgi:DMSO reductase anchor subunit|nr:dimethyl sulfoxide reductase anchor subunit [Burkholderiales bacterium]MCZ8339827.1 dimethyl sulfoxide reductase anchor subunit [Burkholderiaceae bacterium]